MKSIPIEQQILIHSTSNHTQFKDLLLKQIEDAPYEKRNNSEESITKTDYHIKETQREWVKTFVAYTQDTLQTILDTLQFQSANFPSVWFQQYQTNDYHELS